MTMSKARRIVALAAVIVAAAGAMLLGQSVVSTTTDSSDVVRELRRLRTDLVATTTAGVQAQLLVGRLSIQEQRIAALTQQLTALQATLASASRQNENGETVPRQLSPRGIDNYNRMRNEETDLLRRIAEEQGRWTYFSGRLDELERSLPKP